jgi:FKBP-type peptidyl-prolyl cis-trans isomerase
MMAYPNRLFVAKFANPRQITGMFLKKIAGLTATAVTCLLMASVSVSAQGGNARFPAPDDVAGPPEDAIRTASGLAWRMLGKSAERIERPGVFDMVNVRFTGWTTEGVLFDTTEEKKQPRMMRVDAIPGFQEAIQLLSVGETARFWVPEELAYTDGMNRSGMLVLDMTLVGITRGPERPTNLEAPPENAARFDSGLAWVVLEAGVSDQEPPGEESTVLVDYSSWTTDGKLLDSTLHLGKPRPLTMNQMMEGFRETFSTMVPGERRMIWVPPELTEFDGQQLVDEIVVFDVKLLSYMSPPQKPANVSAIPDDAERSVTGLAWRVLKSGTGDVHPREGDTVEVMYAIWTRDGSLFDSSYAHASPGRFVLDETQPFGFNEALFGMIAGEERVFWIPEDLAYGGQKGRPQGMLVFKMELLSIEPRPEP